MITELSCWLTWLSGITKLRDRVMNEAIMPSVIVPAPDSPTLGSPARLMAAPTTASST